MNTPPMAGYFIFVEIENMKTTGTGIKNWSKESRPRERLAEKGPMALTDSELLAILIGTGSGDSSALDLAQKLLGITQHNLNDLSRLSYQEMTKIRGIGPAKAITLQAAFELGVRRRSSEVRQKQKIESSKDVFEYFVTQLGDLPHEEFWVMNLNRSNQVLSLKKISEGGWHSTIVDPKKVFSGALEEKASAIILAHNHPSGSLNPSNEDKRITLKLRRCGLDMELPVLDHLIIASHGYYSFADEGILDL